MNTNQLPDNFLKCILSHNIKETDILYSCPIDLSPDGHYVDGYILFTPTQLILCQSKEYKQVTYFRGTTQKASNDKADAIFSIKSYLLNDIENLHLERQIATNYFVFDSNNMTIKFAVFTNSLLEDINTFIKILSQYINERTLNIEIDTSNTEDEDLYCPNCGAMYPDKAKKICPKCTNKKSIFIRVLKFFTNYRFEFILMFITYFLSALLNLVWPYLNGTILFDHILKQDNAFLSKLGLNNKYILALSLLALTMFISKLTQEIVSMVRMTLMARITAKSIRDIKQQIFTSMGQLSINFFTSKQTGGLMTRVISDAEKVTGFFLDGFPFLFLHTFTIIASFIVMFKLNWMLALAACILLPLLVFISVKLQPNLWSLYGRRHRAERAVTSKANDNLTGARVVKAFGQQECEITHFENPNERLRDAEVRIVKYGNKFTILYNFVQEISSIWVWILGVILVLWTKSINLGVLITFVGYVAQLNGPMNFFSRVIQLWTDSINASQRMFEIIDAIPDIQESDSPIELNKPRGEITLKDVTFGYEINRPILKNINLTIKEGEMLGIVGRSGAGKSTLVNLISRLYDPNEGSILIDGIDIKQLSFSSLRRNVAMVSQDTYIFMGTVADNIAYANPSATREEIINAAILASAHQFISNMPDGYDTIIGAAGKDLSGGEKQRISIARAILANPKILILDEATASVDTQTEKAIQNSINYLVKGRTTLSIAHRLSTLRDADRLIVIDSGQIVEEGTHKELEELGGIYKMLMELQESSALKNYDLLAE